jgi:hypothetical protein
MFDLHKVDLLTSCRVTWLPVREDVAVVTYNLPWTPVTHHTKLKFIFTLFRLVGVCCWWIPGVNSYNDCEEREESCRQTNKRKLWMTGVTKAAVLHHFQSGTWESFSAWCLLHSVLQCVGTLLDHMSLEGCVWWCCSCRVNRNNGERRTAIQMWHLTCVGKWWMHTEFCLGNTKAYQGRDWRVKVKCVGGTDCGLGWSGSGEGVMATFNLLVARVSIPTATRMEKF